MTAPSPPVAPFRPDLDAYFQRIATGAELREVLATTFDRPLPPGPLPGGEGASWPR